MTTTAATIGKIWRAAAFLVVALIIIWGVTGAANAAALSFTSHAGLMSAPGALPAKWLGMASVATLAIAASASLVVMWRDLARHLAKASRKRR